MFNDKREYLLKRALDVESQEDITNDYKKEFFKLVSDVIINMEDGEDSFFGGFMLKIERGIRLDITWPLATIPKANGFLLCKMQVSVTTISSIRVWLKINTSKHNKKFSLYVICLPSGDQSGNEIRYPKVGWIKR